MLVQPTGDVEYIDFIFGYDIKKSDGEAIVMLELRETQSTSSLPLFPGPGEVASDKILWIQ